jgi:hypothetical protein
MLGPGPSYKFWEVINYRRGCDWSHSGRTGSLIAAPGLGKADFCFKGSRLNPPKHSLNDSKGIYDFGT